MKVGTLADKANGIDDVNFGRRTAFWNWVMLRHTRDAMWKVANSALGQFGLSANQYIALSMVCSAKSGVKQGDLAGWLFQEQNTISGLVDRMERKGLISRERSLKDRRQVILQPTDIGRDMAQRAHKVVSEISVEFLSSISMQDHDRLREILLKLRSTAFEYLGISPGELDSVVWTDNREDECYRATVPLPPDSLGHHDLAAPPQGGAKGSRAAGVGASRWARIIRRGVRSVRAKRR